MEKFGEGWVARVRAAGDAVLDEAGINLGSQVQGSGASVDLLWEADPRATDERFPQLGLPASYAGAWDGVHCIDFWLYVDTASGWARTSFEGGSGDDVEVRLTGEAEADAATVGRLLADHLRSPG